MVLQASLVSPTVNIVRSVRDSLKGVMVLYVEGRVVLSSEGRERGHSSRLVVQIVGTFSNRFPNQYVNFQEVFRPDSRYEGGWVVIPMVPRLLDLQADG